jgi:DNA-binding transcriptional regulator YhcF (GntR family)
LPPGCRADRAAGRGERAQHDPRSPYEKIAIELRHSILSGALADGDLAPTEKQLATEHQVAIGTAHRAMELLKTWGFITSSRGRRAIVVRPSSGPLPAATVESPSDSDVLMGAVDEHSVSDAARLWAITLRGPDGRRYPARHVCGDLNRPDSFRAHLLVILESKNLAAPTMAMTGSVAMSWKSANSAKNTRNRCLPCAGRHLDVYRVTFRRPCYPSRMARTRQNFAFSPCR